MPYWILFGCHPNAPHLDTSLQPELHPLWCRKSMGGIIDHSHLEVSSPTCGILSKTSEHLKFKVNQKDFLNYCIVTYCQSHTYLSDLDASCRQTGWTSTFSTQKPKKPPVPSFHNGTALVFDLPLL